MILNFILSSIALQAGEHWLTSIVSLMVIFGLFLIINWTFQSDKKVYFEEQSRIPLNDDTQAEKKLLAQQGKNPLNYEQFDA
jgi:cbb3-type cytochrome oxidase subunit 3